MDVEFSRRMMEKLKEKSEEPNLLKFFKECELDGIPATNK
jgi:hypothetical protein